MKPNKIKEEVLRELEYSVKNHIAYQEISKAIDLTLKKQQEEILKLIDEQVEMYTLKDYKNDIMVFTANQVLEDLKQKIKELKK